MSEQPELRVLFKPDWWTNLWHRGCWLGRKHFDDEMVVVLRALCTTAPLLQGRTLWITEGWRPKRHAGDRSLHPHCRAFDVRCNLAKSINLPRSERIERWCERIREELGVNYDVVPERIGRRGEHLHIEFDPKETDA